MIKLSNVTFALDDFAPGVDIDALLRKKATNLLPIKQGDINAVALFHRSVDARKKERVHFVVTFGVCLYDDDLEIRLAEQRKLPLHTRYEPLEIAPWPADQPRPVVVGTGPAGLFAALYLARAGACPLVLERGQCVEERERSVTSFDNGGALNPNSNIQFGEGGAGTFSDGKLTTNKKNPLMPHVLRWFVDAGAPSDILWLAKPHIGSDNLPGVVRAMRREIEQLGGQVCFNSQVVDVAMVEGNLESISVEDASGVHNVAASALVLACGHSARDTVEMLQQAGLHMEQKPFSMGARIEHLQADVNRAQWACAAGNPALGAADYKMAVHLESGRSAYTFCMCPGGTVTCAASQEGGVVTNGASLYARDGKNANAALLVNVETSDFGSDDVLAGMRLQRSIEQRAFDTVIAAGGTSYGAPAQRVGDFLSAMDVSVPKSVQTNAKGCGTVNPTYARGVCWTDLRGVLPDFICSSMAEALVLMDRKLHGFAQPRAVLTAPETRSSSPVRICRDAQTLQASCSDVQDCGVYPCGEGAGYAGGIMSAAADGLKVAQAVVAAAQHAKRD